MQRRLIIVGGPTQGHMLKKLLTVYFLLADSDPIPTWLLKICASVLTPIITNIVNLSLSSGQFHPTLKESVISPLSSIQGASLHNSPPALFISLIT